MVVVAGWRVYYEAEISGENAELGSVVVKLRLGVYRSYAEAVEAAEQALLLLRFAGYSRLGYNVAKRGVLEE